MQPEVTFIYPIIRTDFIQRSLYTLQKFTYRSKIKIIVVDQSIDGFSRWDINELYRRGDMYIRAENMGFSKAANEGIIHALKWKTPYIVVANDDTEFMYLGWLEDALEEFKTDPQIIAVCPESPRVAGWGYGLSPDKYIEIVAYKDQYNKKDIDYLKAGDYDKEEMQSRHTFELPKTFPYKKRGVIDGIAMWLPIFKREAFIELGLFEERFIWGGGEDYDMLCRAYSCGYPIKREHCDPRFHRRMVSSMKSWVWHWWGNSKDVKETLDPKLFSKKSPWNENKELWGPDFDVWGHYADQNGVKKPLTRLLPVEVA